MPNYSKATEAEKAELDKLIKNPPGRLIPVYKKFKKKDAPESEPGDTYVSFAGSDQIHFLTKHRQYFLKKEDADAMVFDSSKNTQHGDEDEMAALKAKIASKKA